MPPSPQELTTAYRHLLRHSLHAVQFSKPARFVVRDRLRDAFRQTGSEPSSFDAGKVARTLEFLDGATKSTGIEHKIVKNWCFVWWERGKTMRYPMFHKDARAWRLEAYREFDVMIERLNESMGLCIR